MFQLDRSTDRGDQIAACNTDSGDTSAQLLSYALAVRHAIRRSYRSNGNGGSATLDHAIPDNSIDGESPVTFSLFRPLSLM